MQEGSHRQSPKADKDSNQAERFLFPKLKEKGLRTRIDIRAEKGSPDFVGVFFGDEEMMPLMGIAFGDKLN